MHQFVKRALMMFGSLGAMAAAVPAYAGCGETAAFKPATWDGRTDNLFKQVAANTSVVGMWSVRFLSGGNLVDFGFQQWHSDGTEFFNSGGRAPSTQNYCLGVWADEGSGKYKLNHFALAYDSNGTYSALVNIKEEVVINGNSLTGSFTIAAYNPRTLKQLSQVSGNVTGVRVTINTVP